MGVIGSGRRSSTVPGRRVLKAWLGMLAAVAGSAAASQDGLQISHVQTAPPAAVTEFAKLEITFEIEGSTATHPQWPFDTNPPAGLPAGAGITVNAVFTDPAGEEFFQPAFYAEEFLDEVKDGRDWHLPTGTFFWKVRFSPNRPGSWSYRLIATDATGTTTSPRYEFSVKPSAERGFIRVSARDARYFEFDDGTLFTGLGFELPGYLGNPSTEGRHEYAVLGSYGVNFVRVWLSSMFGSAWPNWIGGRNQYRGYLPISGLVPFRDTTTDSTILTLKLDYEADGDTGWFDACRMEFWEGQAESIKPNTLYRIRVAYSGSGIEGPRRPGFLRFGLVAKLGGWHADCYEPAAGTVVTDYGGNTNGFGHVEGRWFSAAHDYLPRMHLALENVKRGAAYIKSVSLREELGDGRLGPELMMEPSMERELYIPEEKAYSLDQIVDAAERSGVYLKLVLMDVNDEIYLKMRDDGGWVERGPDNAQGFYGIGRKVNKTRWLQQMWWRYLQARWGYSTHIHSWELTNEGDPALVRHYELADELGKFMHCRVFGVEPGPGDGARCGLAHPNAHMVTTSFWRWFPGREFWMNAKYPNVDYADVHAYVSTSYAPTADRELMQWDAAYYHTWHSQDLLRLRVGKPVVRGEGGLDATAQQSESVLGISRDKDGVWLHNLLWSTLDSGALYELYWFDTHIWGNTFDHRREYGPLQAFLRDIPLNEGGYEDWGGSVSNAGLRVIGQKSPSTGRMHLWVQNRQHTWKNVVDGAPVAALSGEVSVPGFHPRGAYTLERWDTETVGGRVGSRERVVADAHGTLRLSVTELRTDVALKVSLSGTGEIDESWGR